MITWFRALTQTWIAKVLFLLLVLSFGIWGIEDTVRNFWRETAVVRMEGASIEVPEAQTAARRELQRVTRQLGPTFEPEEPLRRAVAMQAVENLISERAQRLEANRIGVSTPDAVVQEYVFSIPNFQSGGTFNRLILDQWLRQNDMNEAMFLQLVRDDLQRIQLIGAVRTGAMAPASLTNAMVRFEREQRVAQVAEFPLLEAPEPEPPTEAALARFHANNPDRFSSPALREAAVAVLTAETLADQVEVSDADLAAAYEARKSQYETPERRDLQQALVPNEEAARAIAAAWTGNPDFDAIQQAATAAGGGALALGDLTRADLPIESLAAAVFATPAGGVTAPVQSPFGWHVMRVARITPGITTPLAEVADRLRREVALERAGDLAFDRANRVEDAIAGGATLEEAARRYTMTIATVKLDAEGRDAEGLPVVLPVPAAARQEALRAIFTAEMGRAPRLAELRQAEGFMAVELRAITPPALKPLESIADEVRLAFIVDARRRFQEEKAAALLGASRNGASLADAATAQGAQSERMGPFGRQPVAGTPGLTVPPELLPAIFNLRVGEATMVPTRNGFAVAQLLEIIAADPAADPAALANARTTLMSQSADELEAAYLAALRDRAAPRINQTLMQQVVP